MSLIEVMVALAVIAIALGAAVQAASSGTRNLAHIQEKMFAHWVGMNAATRLQLGLEGATLKPGAWQGLNQFAGKDWYWAATAKAFAADPSILRIDVNVAHKQTDRPIETVTVFERVRL